MALFRCGAGTIDKAPVIMIPARNANTGVNSYKSYQMASDGSITSIAKDSSSANQIAWIKSCEFVQDASFTTGGGYSYFNTNITVSKTGTYSIDGVAATYNSGDSLPVMTSEDNHLIVYLD